MSGLSAIDAPTIISRENHRAPTEMEPITRYRASVTAARMAPTTIRNTVLGGGRRAIGTSKSGNTTSKRYARAGRISLGSANTSVSLAVVTG